MTGNGTGTITMTGTLAQINSALSSGKVLYKPNTTASGSSTITMTTSDNGNSGEGGAKTDTDSITVNVTSSARVALTSVQADTTETDSFTVTAQNPAASGTTSLDTALFAITKTGGGNMRTGATTSYLPTNGSGTCLIINDDNIQSTTSGRTTTFTSKAGTFNTLSFVYDDLQNVGAPLFGTVPTPTIQFYTSTGALIGTRNLPFVGNGSGTFNSGDLGQEASYFTIRTGGDLFTVDNMTIGSSALHTIPNGGATTDTTPLISGTVSRALVTGETVQVLRDGVVAGQATVSGTTWNFTDNTTAGNHTYTARLMQGGVVANTSGSSSVVSVGSTPLVLDLNGDGVHTLSADHGTQFDLLNTGTAQNVGWADSHDGLLALDVNQNGRIDNGSELFGENMIKSDGTKATDGWDALAAFDDNQDGEIDNQDVIWGLIKVWNDVNSDGVTDAGELFSLDDIGVDAIQLVHGIDQVQENGNIIAASGLFEMVTGESQVIADVYFSVQEQTTPTQAVIESTVNDAPSSDLQVNSNTSIM